MYLRFATFSVRLNFSEFKLITTFLLSSTTICSNVLIFFGYFQVVGAGGQAWLFKTFHMLDILFVVHCLSRDHHGWVWKKLFKIEVRRLLENAILNFILQIGEQIY